jgi:hypothetical protein
MKECGDNGVSSPDCITFLYQISDIARPNPILRRGFIAEDTPNTPVASRTHSRGRLPFNV